MSLTRAEVEHIARLARLALTDEELERFQRQLSDILAYADRLQSVDTSGIPPTAGFLPGGDELRPDEPGGCLTREELLGNAPLTRSDQFQVPPVLEQKP